MSTAKRVERLERRHKMSVNIVNELNIQLRKKLCYNKITEEQITADEKQLLQELKSLGVQNKKLGIDVQHYKVSGIILIIFLSMNQINASFSR